MSRYALGLDFGTESARALLVDLDSGQETAESMCEFTHGVITEALPVPDGAKLPPEWALQDPRDYIDALEKTVQEVMARAGAEPADVVGIGIDFTACTVLPTRADGTPLCFIDEFRADPHAWVKLWKHHGAAKEAEDLIALAKDREEKSLDYYGGAVSSEWLIPKALQVLRESPRVYEAADRFIEAGDWVVWKLTGVEARNSCAVGYKGMHVHSLGYPSNEFLRSLEPKLGGFYEKKIQGPIVAPGEAVGTLTPEVAGTLGLQTGTPVSACIIDAHAGVPGSGVCKAGEMVIVLGTSFCHMLLGEKEVLFEGFAGLVKDGILKGYFGYESGQTAGGDIFAWFVDNCVPAAYTDDAKARAISTHDLLTEKASALRVGESGLVALDWWNGNRSILMDANLSGMVVGLTLGTKPEEVYRALMESTIFGTRRIIQSYEAAGVPIDKIYACGGLPPKNRFFMQLFADVTGKEILVASSAQTVALGAAVFGAVAAGPDRGGFASEEEAVRAMVKPASVTYSPRPDAAEAYDRLYAHYEKLHDHFGRADRTMHELKRIRDEA